MKKKQLVVFWSFTLLVGLSAGFAGAWFFDYHFGKERVSRTLSALENQNFNEHTPSLPVSFNASKAAQLDLRKPSEVSTPSVVYIKTTSGTEATSWMDVIFFGYSPQKRISSGSGVIYSEDGYIITNNHVIEGADRIEVVQGKRSFDATLVGVDLSTDLAVLKVEAKELPAISIGNSRHIEVGDWVLAVGNPFSLTSTVTAGIVSAKGRRINITKSSFPLESFIQTDAAINPGNSGGALVNLEGELIGVNTAILSNTGSYAGYGFAVPSNVVKKVVEDIIKHNEVQRAFLDAEFQDLDEKTAEYYGIQSLDGVVLSHVTEKGAAEKSGLKKGDVILKVNNYPMRDRAALNEEISFHRPGEKIKITYLREDKPYETTLTLNNREGEPKIIKREFYTSKVLGSVMERVSKVEKERLRIESGVRLVKVNAGIFRKLRIPEGFIVLSVNRNSIEEPEQLETILKGARGKVIMEGLHQNGERAYFTFYI